MALADFLRARWDEDEREPESLALGLWEPARLSEDIGAKREIVDILVADTNRRFEFWRGIAFRDPGERAIHILTILAQPYAGHREYDSAVRDSVGIGAVR